MLRPAFLALALALATGVPLVQAQSARGVMQVSVTVVNTCFFGQQARCHLPEPALRAQPEVVARDGVARRRVVHF